MSLEKKLKDSIMPSLYSGVAGVAIYFAMYDKDLLTPLPLGPIEVPTALAVGATVMVGNMIGETISHFALPMISQYGVAQAIEENVIPPLFASVGSYLAMRTLVSDETYLIPSAIIGGGGSVAGKYVYGMI